MLHTINSGGEILCDNSKSCAELHSIYNNVSGILFRRLISALITVSYVHPTFPSPRPTAKWTHKWPLCWSVRLSGGVCLSEVKKDVLFLCGWVLSSTCSRRTDTAIPFNNVQRWPNMCNMFNSTITLNVMEWKCFESVVSLCPGPYCRVALSRHTKINSIKEVKNFKCYQRLINKQLLQVSGLCGTAFLSYLPNRSTQIYIDLNMRTPYWCTAVVHQYGGRISKKTPGIHFCYENDYFSLVS